MPGIWCPSPTADCLAAAITSRKAAIVLPVLSLVPCSCISPCEQSGLQCCRLTLEIQYDSPWSWYASDTARCSSQVMKALLVDSTAVTGEPSSSAYCRQPSQSASTSDKLELCGIKTQPYLAEG